MSNILNIYDPEAKELVLANLFFYPATYNDAVKIACEQGAEFVHGIDPEDIKKHETALSGETKLEGLLTVET